MASKPLVLQNFSGGWSTDKKIGIEHSFAYSQGLDFRKSPSQVTPLGRTAREDEGTVVDLVQNAVMTNSGDIYGLGDTGQFYRRAVGGNWSAVGNVPAGAYGLSYRADEDSIFIAGQSTVSQYSPLSDSPTLQPSLYSISKSTYDNTANAGFNVDSDQSGGTESIAIQTSYIEGQIDELRYFQTDVEPGNKIGVHILEKGTGDWTLVVHDGFNNQLASVTVLNADLPLSGWGYFVFSDQLRLKVAPAAQTYHFHLTSTVADGTISGTTENNLSSCDMQLWADRLVIPINGMHPMANFQQFICIGNEKYLSVYEPLGEPEPSNSSWQRHKLTFPPGYEVCGLAVFNEFLAIACERATTSEEVPQDGIIFFWDGLSSTYNYFLLVPEGSPYAIHQYKNTIYYYAGGAWYAVPSVTSLPDKIRTMPFGENSFGNNQNSTKIYPYAATVRNGVQLMAYPSVSTNTNLEFGVYSWGQVDKNFAYSFGYSYVISTGTKTYSGANQLTIGMVQNFGDNLLISWRDDENGGYGVDVVNSQSKPAAFSSLETLIYDLGYTGKDKNANFLEATWVPLPDGVTVYLKYSLDRQDWVYSDGFTNQALWQSQDNYAREQMFGATNNKGRFREFQLGIEIHCDDTVTEVPVITSLSTVVDPLNQEVLQ